MKDWPPHPPPNPDWPPHVRATYDEGCRWIDECRKQFDPEGNCPVPFVCYLCRTKRSDFALFTGDGVPLCVGCLGFHPAELDLGPRG